MEDDAKTDKLREYLKNPNPDILRELADFELAAHLKSQNEQKLKDTIMDLETRKVKVERELSLRQARNKVATSSPPEFPLDSAVSALRILTNHYLTKKMGLGTSKQCTELFDTLIELSSNQKWLKTASTPLVDFLVSNNLVEHKFENGLQIRLW